MHLKKIALKRANEPMDAWDPATESWVSEAFLCRVDLTDRFLSNFNRPTRMRMMQHDDQLTLPASMTVRHPGSHDVYVLGTTRKDARGGKTYLGMTLMRLTSDVPGGSAGLATVTRKAPAGPVSDPGWLVDKVVGKFWIDLEFLSSSEERQATDLRVERYNAFAALSADIKDWDFITLHGESHRVLDTFVDSGLFGLRLDQERDTRKDFVLTVSGTRTMNHSTHQWDSTPELSFNVTGVIEHEIDVATWAKETNEVITVYFEADHLPNPLPGVTGREMWLELNGKRRVVKEMETQPGQRQWQLRCL